MLEIKQIEKAYKITDNPCEFDWERVSVIVKNIATKVLKGEKLTSDDYCECSRFNLEDQIIMALKGELIEGLQLIFTSSNIILNSKDNIRIFTREFCFYLWQKICDNWEKQNQQTSLIEETKNSTAKEIDMLIAA